MMFQALMSLSGKNLPLRDGRSEIILGHSNNKNHGKSFCR